MNQPISSLMEILANAKATLDTTPLEEQSAALLSILPDALKAFAALQERNEALSRSKFIASHACRLLQTSIETTEDDEELIGLAKRAVRLASMVLATSESANGV